MGFSLPSEDELKQRGGGDFALLPADEYVVEVKEIEVQPDQKNPYTGDIRDTLKVKFRPIKFADGSPLVDEEGDDVSDDKLLFDFPDPSKVGMKPQPSKFRKFMTAALGLDLKAGFSIDDWDELVGKRMLATVVIKDETENSPRKNRITSYRPIPQRPKRKAAVEEAAEDEAPAKPAKAARSLPGERVTGSTKAAAETLDDEDDDF